VGSAGDQAAAVEARLRPPLRALGVGRGRGSVGRGAGASERHRGTRAAMVGVWGVGREWWPLLPSLPSPSWRWSPSIPSHSQKSGFELLRGSYWAAGRHGLGHGLERDVGPHFLSVRQFGPNHLSASLPGQLGPATSLRRLDRERMDGL